MRKIKLYAHHVNGVSYTKVAAATPFRVTSPDSFELHEPAVAAGVTLVDTLDEADAACLPSVWATYDADHATRRGLVDLVEQAGKQGKPVGLWVWGDDELDLPWSHVVQFQHAFRRSRSSRTTRRALPSIFSDTIDVIFDGSFDLVDRGDRPTVGFCGQARTTFEDRARRVSHKARQRLQRALGSPVVPEPWSSHIRLRSQALKHLAEDRRIADEFIIRDRYRAGGVDKPRQSAERHQANMDFYRNIRDTQYTVCVRGGGNFSVRLYQTLCQGRIPIIVDTDVLLPWPDHPFWSDGALVVPADDLASLPDRVLAHHAAADEAGWVERQHAARAFWQEWLTRTGWLGRLPDLLTLEKPAG